MIAVLAWLALVSLQSTYGPTLPTAPPPAAAGDDLAVASSLEQALRARGMSDDGLRTMRSVPLPAIARGATRSAQCAVEDLRGRNPVPVGDLVSAMEERDATAAAQAQARTQYLAAVLPLLRPADQRVLLSVIGDGAAIGNDAPPRPTLPERARRDDRAASGRPEQDRDRARAGDVAGRLSPRADGTRPRPHDRPTAAASPLRAAPSPCARFLGD